ncbi:MAG: DUF4293 domain-containing protein [Saprospiraceae bacterium]
MIQRIQTVFLLLIVVTYILIFEFPFAISSVAGTGFLADKDFDVYDSPVLLIIAGLGGLLALISIFLYKNRGVQVRLCYLSMVFSILLVVTAVVLFYNQAKTMISKGEIDDSIGIYLPVLILVFGYLASRFIRKDEKTVKSMDRLR